MAALPQSRILTFPLLLLALAMCLGITFEYYLSFQSRSFFICAIALTTALIVFSIAMVPTKRLYAASLCILAAFFLAASPLRAEEPPHLEFVRGLRGQGLIGIDDENPGMLEIKVVKRPVFLFRPGSIKAEWNDLGAMGLRNFRRAVGACRVHNENFFRPGNGTQAARQVVRFVFYRNNDGKRDLQKLFTVSGNSI